MASEGSRLICLWRDQVAGRPLSGVRTRDILPLAHSVRSSVGCSIVLRVQSHSGIISIKMEATWFDIAANRIVHNRTEHDGEASPTSRYLP